MDPEQNLKEIEEALAKKDTQRAMELIEARAEWLEKGGYPGRGGYLRFAQILEKAFREQTWQ